MATPFQITDGERLLSLDTTGVIPAADLDHYQVHKGNAYRATDHALTANGSSFTLTITTPDDKKCQMDFHAFGAGQANLSVFEDVGVTANSGNAVNIFNSDRTSLKTSNAVVLEGATINTTGRNELVNSVIGSDGNSPIDPSLVGKRGPKSIWILKAGVSYSIVLTNTSGSDAELHINLDWFEI